MCKLFIFDKSIAVVDVSIYLDHRACVIRLKFVEIRSLICPTYIFVSSPVVLLYLLLAVNQLIVQLYFFS